MAQEIAKSNQNLLNMLGLSSWLLSFISFALATFSAGSVRDFHTGVSGLTFGWHVVWYNLDAIVLAIVLSVAGFTFALVGTLLILKGIDLSSKIV